MLLAFSGAIARNNVDSANSVKISNSVAALASSRYSGAIANRVLVTSTIFFTIAMNLAPKYR